MSSTKDVSKKTYLGDAVYVSWDGFGFTLTTENGVRVLNTIYLEPDILHKLIDYAESFHKQDEVMDEA